jgi:hypothetical protein
MKKHLLATSAFILLSALLLVAQKAQACDFCGIYTPLLVREHQAKNLEVGVREDLLGYSKTKRDGNDENALGSQNQKINVTEFTAQYSFSDRFSLLTAVPIVNHNIKRRVAGEFDTDSESGVGDVAVYADVVLLRKALRGGGMFQWDFFGGLKLPSGGTDRLSETSQNTWSETGIYGGAVSPGSGSFDFPIATGIRSEFNSWLVDALVQYNLRTEGDQSYQYGNDLRWNVGVGRRFYEDHDFSFDGQLFLSGLTKNKDTQNGFDVVDTGQSFLAFGPRVDLTFNNRYLVYVKIDAPISNDNDGLQTLQDHRVQIGFNARL